MIPSFPIPSFPILTAYPPCAVRATVSVGRTPEVSTVTTLPRPGPHTVPRSLAGSPLGTIDYNINNILNNNPPAHAAGSAGGPMTVAWP